MSHYTSKITLNYTTIIYNTLCKRMCIIRAHTESRIHVNPNPHPGGGGFHASIVVIATVATPVCAYGKSVEWKMKVKTKGKML